jgi:hypothetical protein
MKYEFKKNAIIEYLNESENMQSNEIIAYHGTDNKFNIFNDTNPIFFVDDIDVARTYGNFIIKCKLIMDNPIILDFDGKSTYYFFDKWYLPSDLAKRIKDISDDIKNRYSLDDDLKEYLESLDFSDMYGELDGIIMKNIDDVGDGIFSDNKNATNYVVFDKNNIIIQK